MSDSAYCKELDDLWFQSGASQTLMEVTSDNQYGGPIGLDPGKLRDAASKASKLAADAPAGATGEGKSVKDHFNEAATELNAATSGQPGKWVSTTSRWWRGRQLLQLRIHTLGGQVTVQPAAASRAATRSTFSGPAS